MFLRAHGAGAHNDIVVHLQYETCIDRSRSVVAVFSLHIMDHGAHMEQVHGETAGAQLMPRKVKKYTKGYAIAQIANLPALKFGKRWTFRLPRAERVILRALADSDMLNLREFVGYRGRNNPYAVYICRLRKKLPKGVMIENEWGGVYYMTYESKQILKKYERK